MRRQASEEGDWELADRITLLATPVFYKTKGDGSVKISWQLIPYMQLKELCKAAKDYGRGSPYFKNLLQITFSNFVLVPHDIKNIISCLLSPAEYMIWERAWKKQLRQLLEIYHKDNNLAIVTIDQLCGEGDFEKAFEQAQVLRTF